MEDAVAALTLSDDGVEVDATLAEGAVVLLTDLTDDALTLVLCRVPLAHDIARAAQASRRLKHVAELAFAVRPFSPEVLTLRHHNGEPRHVAVTDDGHILIGRNSGAPGDREGFVDAFRGDELVRSIRTSLIIALALLPGGTRFIIGSTDRTVQLFCFGGQLERTFDMGDFLVRCVAALPDGVHFVVSLFDHQQNYPVRLYHVDGTLVHTFEGAHDEGVNAVAVTPDGQHIVSGADDRLVKVWSVATRSLVSTCVGHTHRVAAVAAMPDGQRILSGGRGQVCVWLLDGTPENIFSELHKCCVNALVALPDNEHALSASDDEQVNFTIKLFNVNDGAVLRNFAHLNQSHHTRDVYSLALMPDGIRFVSSSYDQTTCIVEHGLAFEPGRAPFEMNSRLEVWAGATTAARAAHGLNGIAWLRAGLQAQLEQRLGRLSELEAELEAAAGNLPRVHRASVRLAAAVAQIRVNGDYDEGEDDFLRRWE